jgi:hypothetical protein
MVYARFSHGFRMVFSICAIWAILIWGHAGLIHALLRKESKKNGCYSCVIQGRTYTLSSHIFIA